MNSGFVLCQTSGKAWRGRFERIHRYRRDAGTGSGSDRPCFIFRVSEEYDRRKYRFGLSARKIGLVTFAVLIGKGGDGDSTAIFGINDGGKAKTVYTPCERGFRTQCFQSESFQQDSSMRRNSMFAPVDISFFLRQNESGRGCFVR